MWDLCKWDSSHMHWFHTEYKCVYIWHIKIVKELHRLIISAALLRSYHIWYLFSKNKKRKWYIVDTYPKKSIIYSWVSNSHKKDIIDVNSYGQSYPLSEFIMPNWAEDNRGTNCTSHGGMIKPYKLRLGEKRLTMMDLNFIIFFLLNR